MNLFDTLALYGGYVSGEPGRSSLPAGAGFNPERSMTPEQHRKRKQQVGGVVEADSAGTQGTLPDLYDVVDPRGRVLHKDLGYEQAKRASEARRYAKVVPARRGDTQDIRRFIPKDQEDKGKRIPSKMERKILDRRSMQTPDVDWKQGAQ